MRTGEKRKRLPNWLVGIVLVVVLAIASAFAYTKTVPWSDPYTVKAVFGSAANIRADSPVRIAGVNVGTVSAIEHLTPDEADDLSVQASDAPVPSGTLPTATVVTMELEESALPLHTDATMKLRPRLFLEGNLFVDLNPGSPNAEVAEDGYEFPLGQTSIAVQLDQVLTTLQADVRTDLQTLLDQFGNALTKHGGAEGFREFYRTSPGAFRYTSVVNEAFLGTEPNDLSKLIVNLDSTVDALNQGGELQDLVTNLSTVLGSFAAESDALENAIRELPGVLEEGRPALASLNASFPAVRAFAREALPGVRSTPATLDAATPLLRQVRLLVSKDELRGLVADLRPTIPRLAKLSKRTVPFLRQGRRLSSCFNEVIIPWSQDTIGNTSEPAAYPYDDQPTEVDGRVAKVYEELGYGLVGISGESRSGDSNGPYIRVLAGGGPDTVVIPDPVTGDLNFPETIRGGLPAIESSAKTPFRPDVRCETQDPPNLDPGAASQTPPRTSPTTAPLALSEPSVSPSLVEKVKDSQADLTTALEGSRERMARRSYRAFEKSFAKAGDQLIASSGLEGVLDRIKELASR
jgi:ABC-type transporter Mla subunit MlaD